MKADAELVCGALLLGMCGLLGYLSLQLGQVELGSDSYPVYADFITAGGLQDGAVIELAGVEIGRVERVRLADYKARVTLKIRNDITLHEDTQAAIKTKGLIGERYVVITPGYSSASIAPGGTIDKTLEPVDIQQLIGEFIFGSVGNSRAPEQTTENGRDRQKNEGSTDPWSLGLDEPL
jgi:phospholipid/cholesterol/gamma-HCH transport system substrate-binding protein